MDERLELGWRWPLGAGGFSSSGDVAMTTFSNQFDDVFSLCRSCFRNVTSKYTVVQRIEYSIEAIIRQGKMLVFGDPTYCGSFKASTDA